jgi:hypothetical protein
MRKNIPFTSEETSRICAMTREGRTQKEIAQELNRSKSGITLVQKRMRVSKWRRLDARTTAEIVGLGLAQVGLARTSRATRISEPKVRKIWREHGITHKRGGVPLALPPKKLEAVVGAIRSKQFYAKQVAAKFGLTKHHALRLAHELCGISKFVGGSFTPPLTPAADCPERTCRAACNAQYVALISKLFPAGLPCGPQHDASLVAGLVEGFSECFSWSDSPELRAKISEAVAVLRQSSATIH